MSSAIGAVGSNSAATGVGQAGEGGAEKAKKHHKHKEAMDAMNKIANGMGTAADPAVQSVTAGGQAAAPSQQAGTSVPAATQAST